MRHLIFIFCILLSLCGFSASAQSHLEVESENFIIRYKVNSTEIDEEVLDNRENLAKISAYLRRSPRIDSIVIYSYASPEGGFLNNERLAKGRGATAKKFFLDNLPEGSNFPDSLIKIDHTPENWAGLYALVQEQYQGYDKERILNIITDDSVGPETKKWRLQQLDNGQTWRYILDNYMPLLRYSTWICVWVPPVTVLEEVEPIVVKDPAKTRMASLAQPRPRTQPEPQEIIPEEGSRTVVGLKTNMLYDAATAVNYAVEIPFNEKFSLQLQQHTPWWLTKSNKHCLQFLSLGGEFRWWFAPRPRHASEDRKLRDALMGHFVGVYGFSGKSDIQWGRDFGCYQFEFVSGGLTYGYAMPVGKYLNLEFSISAGYARIPYQHYIPTDDWQILIRDKNKAGTLHYVGPTKAEISLVIPIRANFKKKGGAR